MKQAMITVLSAMMLLGSGNVLADNHGKGKEKKMDKAAMGQQVDISESVFQWTGTKKIGSSHTGKINLKSAELKTEGNKVVGGTFVMDMTTMTVEDLEGSMRDRFLKHVRTEDFFEVNSYPIATLVIDKIEGEQAHGTLTIKKKPVKVSVPFKKNGNAYEGTLKFDRTKHGITYNSAGFFKAIGADKVINDEVELKFKVAMK